MKTDLAKVEYTVLRCTSEHAVGIVLCVFRDTAQPSPTVQYRYSIVHSSLLGLLAELLN